MKSKNKINGSASALHRDSFKVQLKTIRFAASNSPWHFLLASSHYHCLFPLQIAHSSIAVLSWNAMFIAYAVSCTYSTLYSVHCTLYSMQCTHPDVLYIFVQFSNYYYLFSSSFVYFYSIFRIIYGLAQ